jgi:hypothetical protein
MSQYVPAQVPIDPRELSGFLTQELYRISRAVSDQNGFLSLAPLASEPDKYFEGMVVLADGTNWNPGAGAGYYGYHSNAWNKLG